MTFALDDAATKVRSAAPVQGLAAPSCQRYAKDARALADWEGADEFVRVGE